LMTTYFDDIFSAGISSTAMRYSVYCSEQIAYANKQVIEKQVVILPYLKDFVFNDVNHQICSCWNVKPVNPIAKTPVFSNVPALLGSGDTDPYCRPIYNDLIHHYMPNSQRLIFINKSHGPLMNTKYGDDLIAQFFNHPFSRLVPDGQRVKTY
jgi:hypothetical protein